nr:hypothetical protein [Tanacetum cinerariifolium]
TFPLRSLSLYVPFPKASVTSYGPSHFGPSLPPSSVWLASLLWSRLISRASSFFIMSTSVVLNANFYWYHRFCPICQREWCFSIAGLDHSMPHHTTPPSAPPYPTTDSPPSSPHPSPAAAAIFTTAATSPPPPLLHHHHATATLVTTAAIPTTTITAAQPRTETTTPLLF